METIISECQTDGLFWNLDVNILRSGSPPTFASHAPAESGTASPAPSAVPRTSSGWGEIKTQKNGNSIEVWFEASNNIALWKKSKSMCPLWLVLLLLQCFSTVPLQGSYNFVCWGKNGLNCWKPFVGMSNFPNHDPIRYQCLRCISCDLCQDCFFRGRTGRRHRLDHPMQEYCYRWIERNEIPTKINIWIRRLNLQELEEGRHEGLCQDSAEQPEEEEAEPGMGSRSSQKDT